MSDPEEIEKEREYLLALYDKIQETDKEYLENFSMDTRPKYFSENSRIRIAKQYEGESVKASFVAESVDGRLKKKNVVETLAKFYGKNYR